MPGEPRELYEAGLRGDLAGLEVSAEALAREGTDASRAWELVLRGLLWFASVSPRAPGLPQSTRRGEPVPASGLAALAGASEEVRAIGALACAQDVRARVLAFDVAGLDRAVSGFSDLCADLRAIEAQGWLAVARAWQRVVRGQDVPELEDVVRQAARDRRADLLIEAMTVRALGAAEQQDLDGALKLARRASLMARTESMPQVEYLAHLVLARLRRLTGRPHLATRILSALHRVVTPPWWPWLAWELVLARGRLGRKRPEDGEAAHALAALLEAAQTGDRARHDALASQERVALGAFAPLARDLEHVLGAVDPSAVPLPGLEPFCGGHEHQPPRGLQGICGEGAPETAPVAWVHSAPGARPRRVLAPGAGLVRRLGHTLGADTIDGRQLRTDSAIAVLALAGPDGLDEGSLFRTLYGFEFEAARHQSVRAVLYGRVRERLGTAAVLERGDGRVRLVHEGVLLVPDPRCTPPAEVRILGVLAERHQAGAKDVAATLGIPLRTAQDALHRLAEDGALRAERFAKGLHYILEDTTFSEPTRKGRLDS